MTKKSLIFGASGQDGHYLNEILVSKHHQVLKVSRTRSQQNGDISNFSFVHNVINSFRPDYIFHFAANSDIRGEKYAENFNAIVLGSFNVLESVKRLSLQTKIFLSGSCLQFKQTGKPLNEESELCNNDFYALFRNQSLEMARLYRKKYSLKVYFGFFFNHDSSLREGNFFNSKILNIAKNANLKGKKIDLGNLSNIKEFNFAPDVMEAVFLIVNQEKHFEFVIGSGAGYTLRRWAELCFAKVGKDLNQYITESKNSLETYMVSDPKKLLNLGWLPSNDIKFLLDKMFSGEL